jgi:phospholipid transport system substrate-binding protein
MGNRIKRSAATGVAVAVLLTVVAVSVGQAAATGASTAIGTFYAGLLAAMQSGPTIGVNGRYRQLEPVVGETFDLPFMTSAAVGPGWAGLSPVDQQRMTDAFRRYIVATYADRFDKYSGQKLQVMDEQARAPDIIVDTQIVKADGKPVAIKYRMHQVGGRWRVADVFLDGTISELAVRRSEFSAILQQQGVGGLIAALNKKTNAMLGSATN